MERIGEYLVRRLVGEGGMGKVFEAEERLSKRRVALKVLRPELSRSDEARRLFLNEMTILAHLDHPNVVRCLACSEVDGELVMALEYLEGQTLRELVGQTEQARLPWTQAVAIAGQIAAGLGAAHAQSPPIIHRDLKPENVIVLPDGQVKVMDFGIAKVLEALHRTTLGLASQSVGTLQYMSPEQIDATSLDGRSDLYSLGLILYELLAGRPPFQSASPRELLNMQCTAAPPALPEQVRASLPRGIERLLFALLAKRPDERPADAQAVLTALEPFTTGEGGFCAMTLPTSSTTVAPGAEPPSAPPRSGATVPSPGSTHPASPAVARRPVGESNPARVNDTIGLVERASSAGRIPTAWGIAVVVVLSLLAGGLTYALKLAGASSAESSASGEPVVEALR